MFCQLTTSIDCLLPLLGHPALQSNEYYRLIDYSNRLFNMFDFHIRGLLNSTKFRELKYVRKCKLLVSCIKFDWTYLFNFFGKFQCFEQKLNIIGKNLNPAPLKLCLAIYVPVCTHNLTLFLITSPWKVIWIFENSVKDCNDKKRNLNIIQIYVHFKYFWVVYDFLKLKISFIKEVCSLNNITTKS